MKYYAQINEDNIVIGVSHLSAEVISDKLIPLEANDKLILGMTYDRENEIFKDTPKIIEKEAIKPPTQLELMQIELTEIKSLLTQLLTK